MVLLTGIVMFTGVLVSWNVTHRSKDFFILYFLLLSGVFGVFVSLDLFFLFFFYELAVLPMYLLIGVWGSSSDFGTFVRTKEYGAMKLMLYLVAGSVLIWIALMAIFAQADLGTFNFVALHEYGEFPVAFQRIFFPFLMVGFGVLAGMWPFHTWSPDGHVAAPTAVSMVHAGVLMKLGAYGILRVGMGLMPEGAETWMPVLIGLGTVNVLYGAVSALGQRDLKYVVGYSSVSHMGYVLMGLATLHYLGVSGAVLQMFSHGIMTALFFAVVGAIYDATHTRDIGVLEGMAKPMGKDDDALRHRRADVPGAARAERVRRRASRVPGAVPDLPGAGGARRDRGSHHGRLHPAANLQSLLRHYGRALGSFDGLRRGRFDRLGRGRPARHIQGRGHFGRAAGGVHIPHGPAALPVHQRHRRERGEAPRSHGGRRMNKAYPKSLLPRETVINVVPKRGTWGWVGLDHARRRRHYHPICGLCTTAVIPALSRNPSPVAAVRPTPPHEDKPAVIPAPSRAHRPCYENSTRPPRHVVPKRGTWGWVGLDHARRRRHYHPLVWPTPGRGDSG